MGSRLVCFIGTDGGVGICTHHYDDIHMEGDCSTCDFPDKFKGIEEQHFSYVHWTGKLIGLPDIEKLIVTHKERDV